MIYKPENKYICNTLANKFLFLIYTTKLPMFIFTAQLGCQLTRTQNILKIAIHTTKRFSVLIPRNRLIVKDFQTFVINAIFRKLFKYKKPNCYPNHGPSRQDSKNPNENQGPEVVDIPRNFRNIQYRVPVDKIVNRNT